MESISTAGIAVKPICSALSLPTSAYYRLLSSSKKSKQTRTSHRALSPVERAAVLGFLHEKRFVDKAPAQVYSSLLDEGKILCSIRTMYRFLAAEKEVRERRNQARHPVHQKPELVATAPNQVWSWDITKLKTYTKWNYLYLYVIMDIFSRYIVGWMIAHRENARLAKRLIAESTDRQGIQPHQLTLHSDRGSPMIAQTTSQLLSKLDITPSLNRPRVSNDNPYSESAFKTLKYYPGFPDRFVGMTDGLEHSRKFFEYYNDHHHHSGLALLTPADVHYQRAEGIIAKRQEALNQAYLLKPHRFVNGPPKAPQPPREVWINKPQKAVTNAH